MLRMKLLICEDVLYDGTCFGNGFAREGYPVRGLFSIPFAGLDEKGIPMFDINGNITSTDINFHEM